MRGKDTKDSVKIFEKGLEIEREKREKRGEIERKERREREEERERRQGRDVILSLTIILFADSSVDDVIKVIISLLPPPLSHTRAHMLIYLLKARAQSYPFSFSPTHTPVCADFLFQFCVDFMTTLDAIIFCEPYTSG